MTESQMSLLHDFITQLPDSCKSFYKALADYSVGLGYTPHKTKTGILNLDFRKNRLKQTILKLEPPEAASGIGPKLRLKFYACQSYSDIFKKSLQKVIEDHDGRYTGCYGCGRCACRPQGYTYEYTDGRKVFRCGGELIPILDVSTNHLAEIKNLMAEQDSYWTAHRG